MRRTAIAVGVVLLLLSAVAPAGGVAAPTGDVPADVGTQDLECSFPFTATDASGDEVTVDAEPERVVTLNPSAAQTMWELGASEKVVGVSQFAGFLDGADEREVVTSGSPSSVNAEQVIGLEPDLVLAPNTIPNETVSQLRNGGVTVYRFAAAASIEDIYEKTELFGQLTGECEGATATVEEMRDRVQTVESTVEGEEQPSAFYDMGSGYTVGPNTFIGQIIDRAGGHNIVADANTSNPYPQLSAEFVVDQDPEFIVVSTTPDRLDEDPSEFVPEDSALRDTTAWAEGNVVVLDTNHVSQPAPRVVEPMTQLAQAFHPDAYAAANDTATTTEPTQTTGSPTDDAPTDDATTAATTMSTTAEATTTAATTENTGTTIPGFGIPVALVAALAAALLARRSA